MDCRHEFTLCRLCLCESECFIDIFQENEWFGYVTAEVIRDLLQFQVSETDGYPRVVCSICLGKLTDFKEFKQRCQDSRDTYSNVFASDESHAEHPIDDEEPMKLEPKDPLDTQEGQEEDEVWPLKLEPKDPLDTQEGQEEITKCTVDFIPLDYLEHLRKRTLHESYGPSESCVNDVGKPSLKIRGKVAVDASPGEDDNLPGSAKVKVGKMDIKVGNDCRSPDERIYLIPVEKSDMHRVESRRELTERREDVNRVDAGVDAIVEEGETFTLKLESRSESERERGEEAPVGVEERGGKKGRFRCNDCYKDFEKKEVLIRHLGEHGYLVNGGSCSEGRESQADAVLNCASTRDTNKVRKKGLKGKLSDSVKKDQVVGKYVCDSCGKAFKRLGHLKVHFRLHSGEKPFVCNVCGKRFSDNSNLRVHERTHTGEKPYVCKVCCKGFTQRHRLVIHTSAHSGDKLYACQICDRCFCDGSNLSKHLRIHSREKPLDCHMCNRRFLSSSNLRKHVRTHSQGKAFRCEICDKCFRRNYTLKQHLTIHSSEKPFVCQVCNKSFVCSYNLKVHLRIHTQEKPYVCPECNTGFRTNYALKQHSRIHSQE